MDGGERVKEEIFGSRVRELRKSKKMTQEQFAKSVGLSRTYIADLETYRKSPSLGTLRKLANKFDTTIGYLVGESDE